MNARQHQRGVILIITLIALVIVLIAAVAMIRSADTSNVIAGNIAFKRDATNEAERAIQVVLTSFESASGALNGTAAPQANVASANYSATQLPSDVHGIPTVLLNDTAFAASFTGADLPIDPANANAGTIRYVVDRMCSATGAATAATCQLFQDPADQGKGVGEAKPGAGAQAIYRISVRVTGPRNTQIFVQSTFAE